MHGSKVIKEASYTLIIGPVIGIDIDIGLSPLLLQLLLVRRRILLRFLSPISGDRLLQLGIDPGHHMCRLLLRDWSFTGHRSLEISRHFAMGHSRSSCIVHRLLLLLELLLLLLLHLLMLHLLLLLLLLDLLLLLLLLLLHQCVRSDERSSRIAG